MVYVPGLDGTGELLFKQTDELSKRYRLATFRLSDSADITYEDLTAHIASIIADLGDPKAMIVGESFGGTLALTFALHYPDLVERLVIVNSFPRFRGRVRIRLAAFLAAKLPFKVVSVARRAACVIGLYLDGVTSADRLRVYRVLNKVNKVGFARRLQLIADLDLEPLLGRINTRCLFIAGERDLLVPSAKEAGKMAKLINDSTVRIISGAGHACLLGTRVSLAELIQDWTTSGY